LLPFLNLKSRKMLKGGRIQLVGYVLGDKPFYLHLKIGADFKLSRERRWILNLHMNGYLTYANNAKHLGMQRNNVLQVQSGCQKIK